MHTILCTGVCIATQKVWAEVWKKKSGQTLVIPLHVDKIAREVGVLLDRAEAPPLSDIDKHAKWLEDAVRQITDALVPTARKSPYAKRWWTADLSSLRKRYRWTRNKARASRRPGSISASLEEVAKQAKRTCFYAVRQQKKSHWQEFLREASNIWEVSKYVKEGIGSAFGKIPGIKATTPGEIVLEKIKDMPDQLLVDFFSTAS